MRLIKMDNLYPFVIFPYFTVKHYYDMFGLEIFGPEVCAIEGGKAVVLIEFVEN